MKAICLITLSRDLMKEENKDLIKALLEHSASLQEDIFDDTKRCWHRAFICRSWPAARCS